MIHFVSIYLAIGLFLAMAMHEQDSGDIDPRHLDPEEQMREFWILLFLFFLWPAFLGMVSGTDEDDSA